MSNTIVPGENIPNQPVSNPCMGLYLDRPSHTIDPRGIEACNNVRIELGRIRNDLMGTSQLGTFTLNGPVDLIDSFQFTMGPEQLILGTPTDLYSYNAGTPVYITPAYTTGTITINNASPNLTGVGTFWNTPIGGNSTSFAEADAAPGATAISVNIVPADLTVGTLVADSTNYSAIQVGTTVAAISGNSILLSKPLAFKVFAWDMIRFGGQLANFRTNARAGDQIAFTSASENTTSATWYTIKTIISDTSITLLTNYVGSNLSGHAYTIRQCATNWDISPGAPFGSYTNHWETETFPQAGAPYNKDMWFATNGADPVIAWDGASTFASYVTTIPFIATTIRRYKNMMVYGGLIGSNGQLLPTSIANSDNSLPTVMAGGVAFQGVASDGPFVISHMGVLGSVLMLYMGSASGQGGTVTSASFIGLPNIWAFSEIIRGRGPIAGRLVAEFPDRHQFIGSDGMYRYNGLFIQIMNDQVWRAVLKNFDRSRADRGFATINQSYGDIHWAVPLQTDSSTPLQTAYTEHYMEQPNSFLFKPYTQRDFAYSCAGIWPNVTGWTWNNDGQAFSADPFPIFTNTVTPASLPLHLVGDVSGKVWQLYQTAASGLTSWVRYPRRIIGSGRSRALIKRVYPFIEPVTAPLYTVTVILSLSDAIGGPITINDSQQFDPGYGASADGTKFRYTKHWRRGRVAQVTIGTQGCTGAEIFVIDGYDWDWVPGGLR